MAPQVAWNNCFSLCHHHGRSNLHGVSLSPHSSTLLLSVVLCGSCSLQKDAWAGCLFPTSAFLGPTTSLVCEGTSHTLWAALHCLQWDPAWRSSWMRVKAACFWLLHFPIEMLPASPHYYPFPTLSSFLFLLCGPFVSQHPFLPRGYIP